MPENTIEPQPFMDRPEVAEWWHISERHIRRLAESGRLSYFKIGGKQRFSRADLDRFLEDARVERTGSAAATPVEADEVDADPHSVQVSGDGSILTDDDTSPGPVLSTLDRQGDPCSVAFRPAEADQTVGQVS